MARFLLLTIRCGILGDWRLKVFQPILTILSKNFQPCHALGIGAIKSGGGCPTWDRWHALIASPAYYHETLRSRDRPAPGET